MRREPEGNGLLLDGLAALVIGSFFVFGLGLERRELAVLTLVVLAAALTVALVRNARC
ncbi:MAG TPA: hypothetical protein VGK73_13105 [Polyangiaceae bacterium]